jgi:hypothetical protein
MLIGPASMLISTHNDPEPTGGMGRGKRQRLAERSTKTLVERLSTAVPPSSLAM